MVHHATRSSVVQACYRRHVVTTTLSRAAAWALLTEWTTSDSLRKHALAVEAAVRGYARSFGEDETAWGIVALLHDFDYERFPTAAITRFVGARNWSGAVTRRGSRERFSRTPTTRASRGKARSKRRSSPVTRWLAW